mgnify:CR=1 FL=1
MAFEDYKDLDFKPEKATQEEIEQLRKNMECQILMIVQWQENFLVDKKNKIKENYLSYIRYWVNGRRRLSWR